MITGIALTWAVACGSGPGDDLTRLRAQNAFEEQRWDQLRLYAEDLLTSDPDDAEAHRLAARAWLRGAGQSAGRCLQHWSAVLETIPGDREARVGGARCHQKLGEHEAVLIMLEGVAGAEAIRLRGEALVGLFPERARAYLESVTSEAPADHQLASLLARACEQVSDAECVRSSAERAVRLNPLDLPSRYLLQRYWSRVGDPAEAARHAEIHRLALVLAVRDSASSTPIELVRAYKQLEQRLDLRDERSRVVAIELYLAAGMRREAEQLLSELLAEAPPPSISPLRLSGYAERSGRIELALELLPRAEEVGMDNSTRRDVIHREARLRGLREPDLAIELLESSLRRDPHVARHRCLLGDLYLQSDAPEGAATELRRGVDLAPWRSDCRLLLAEVLHSGGRRDEVEELLAGAPRPQEFEAFRSRYGY